MKIKPVTDAVTPNYPDKYNENIKRILTTSKPGRWIGTPLIGVLSAAVTLGLGGCADPKESENGELNNPIAILTPSITPTMHVLMGDVPAPTQYQFQGTYIPLFEFGKGTGSIGCVAITAPVFMSEEDAFAIIAAAFSEAGLLMTHYPGNIKNMNLPVTNLDGEDVENKTVQGTLTPDGKLTSYDLPVAFVSTSNVHSWHKEIGDGPFISRSVFYIKQAAQTLSENNAGLIVFYDPVAGNMDANKWWGLEREDGESDESFTARANAVRDEERKNAVAESEILLRQQVEAFIEWLFDMN